MQRFHEKDTENSKRQGLENLPKQMDILITQE